MTEHGATGLSVPPMWLVHLVERLDEYRDAADATWVRLNRIPVWPGDQPLRMYCNCAATLRTLEGTGDGYIAQPQAQPQELYARPVPIRTELGDEMAHVWIARCPGCRTIYWAGPVMLT